jgi:hypothetical protein
VRPRKETLGPWQSLGTFMLPATRADGAVCVFGVNPQADGTFVVIGIQTPRAGDAVSVLEQHAHELIGTFPSPTGAMVAAEQAAAAWLKGTEIGKLCDCHRGKRRGKWHPLKLREGGRLAARVPS